MPKNITDILEEARKKIASQLIYIGQEAAETVNEAIRENKQLIEDWQTSHNLPNDIVSAYNKGVEDAAKVIIELGKNNVGMVHDINFHEAEAIRRLKK